MLRKLGLWKNANVQVTFSKHTSINYSTNATDGKNEEDVDGLIKAEEVSDDREPLSDCRRSCNDSDTVKETPSATVSRCVTGANYNVSFFRRKQIIILGYKVAHKKGVLVKFLRNLFLKLSQGGPLVKQFLIIKSL